MIWRGLLVSVRNAAEAAEALAGGASIIDVKEPLAGPLGAAGPAAIVEIARVVGRRKPWTMACGELLEGVAAILDRIGQVVVLLDGAAVPPAAVKVGLAGMAAADWQDRLAEVRAGLPAGISQVAVAYADWKPVAAPCPREVIEAAARLGCGMLLVDTADKSAGRLLESTPEAELAGWVAHARRRGLGVALAGRIAIAEIPAVVALGPDVVALRSAVCSNGRLGSVQRRLVHEAVAAAAWPATAFQAAFGDQQL